MFALSWYYEGSLHWHIIIVKSFLRIPNRAIIIQIVFCVIGLFIFLIEIEVFFVENVDDLDVMDVDLQGLQRETVDHIIKVSLQLFLTFL